MPENYPPPVYYADLGISSTATNNEIRAAFQKLAKLHHPDKKGPADDGDASEFRKVREAYETLSDPQARAAYDRSHSLTTPSNPFPRQESGKSPANVFQGHARRQASGQASNTTYSFSASEFSEHAFTPRSTPTSPYSSQRGSSPFPSHFRSRSSPQAPQRHTAHGVGVAMSEHPATKQTNCPYKAEQWNRQSGTDCCIFCMTPGRDISRCPGCEAAACPACLKEVARDGTKSKDGLKPSPFPYYYSGG